MPRTDADQDELGDVPGAASSSSRASAIYTQDDLDKAIAKERKRQSGLNDAIERLKKQYRDKTDELNSREDEWGTTEAELRKQVNDASKKAKDAEKSVLDAQAEKVDLTSKLSKATTREKFAKLIADSEQYRNLLPDFLSGDLKLREDYDDDDSYIAYLDRQAKKLTPASSETSTTPPPPKPPTLEERMRGATPASSARVVETAKVKRDKVDIADEMMQHDSGSDKYAELFKELQEVSQ